MGCCRRSCQLTRICVLTTCRLGASNWLCGAWTGVWLQRAGRLRLAPRPTCFRCVGLEVCFQRGLFSGRIAPCLERRRKNLRQRPVFSSSDPPHLQPPSLVMGCCASKALNTDVVDGEKLACGPDADHMPAKTESSSQSEAAMPAAAVSEAAKPQVATETLVSPPVPAPATELEAASTRDLAAAPPNEATLPATTEAVPPPAATAASTEPAS